MEAYSKVKISTSSSKGKFISLYAATLLSFCNKISTILSFPPIILHQALNKPPFTRERPPLVALPMQKRSPMAVYPHSNSILVRKQTEL